MERGRREYSSRRQILLPSLFSKLTLTPHDDSRPPPHLRYHTIDGTRPIAFCKVGLIWTTLRGHRDESGDIIRGCAKLPSEFILGHPLTAGEDIPDDEDVIIRAIAAGCLGFIDCDVSDGFISPSSTVKLTVEFSLNRAIFEIS